MMMKTCSREQDVLDAPARAAEKRERERQNALKASYFE